MADHPANELTDYMPNFTLRPAQESEFRVIKDLIHLTGINPMGLDWKRFIVAVNDQDQILGIGQLKLHGPSGDVLELASIAVYPEYRSQGIARAIIGYLLKDSPRPLYLTCISSLGPLYEKFGFRTISPDEMPRYFRRISKLANVLFTFADRDDRLLVMKLQ
jgi:N-acetylglutamate synthase-like GNAT family acetyltransferase